MSTRIIHRPARSTPSRPRPEDRLLELPPAMPEGDSNIRQFLMLIPLLGAGASMTVMMLFRGSSLAAVGALMMILTVLASVVMVFSQQGKSVRQRQQARDRYLDYLERQRASLMDYEHEFALASRQADAEPRALLDLARSDSRIWERRRDDGDFLAVRLGTGRAAQCQFQQGGQADAMQVLDEFMQSERDLLLERFSTGRDIPQVLDVAGRGNVSVIGDREFVLRLSRVLLAQATVTSSPEDLTVALAADEDAIQDWQWISWLPHLADQSQTTPQGPMRRVARDLEALTQLFRSELHARSSTAAEMKRNFLKGDPGGQFARVIIVADQQGRRAQTFLSVDRESGVAELGMTLVHLLSEREHEPDDIAVRITQRAPGSDELVLEEYERRDTAPRQRSIRLDEFSAADMSALTHHLSGLRLSPDSLEHDAGRQAVEATELLGLPDLHNFDAKRQWAPRPRTSFLRIPIGTDDDARPVMLDLKEAAHFGMGPHGLCVGATGSGKSELLRTLILGLLSTHGPDDVAMVLVDYKGGATFAPFEGAPQVAGVITNLSDDANLVERVYASLTGEVNRRQQVLKDHGNLADISAYRRLRAERSRQGEHLPPLPHLLVIIDEFGELLTARPDFIELFLSIGRIGRSIGVHLLLSSQRIEGGRLRGLDTYLSYRIGLRTLSESESRTVLETPDAFALPPLPGYGYLKVDTTTYTRFRSGYVSGPLPDSEGNANQAAPPRVLPLSTYASLGEADDSAVSPDGGMGSDSSPDEDDHPDEPTVLGTLVDQLAREPRTAAPVWLPPLPDATTLDEVSGTPHLTNAGLRIPRSGPLRVPMGLVDDPAHQWQDVWHLNLNRAGGHLIVVGAPRSGRTTMLRTMAASLSLTHSPSEVVVYAVDLLSTNLLALAELPIVGGVALRAEHEVVRRTIEEISAMIASRETLFQQAGAESVEAARKLASEGHPVLSGAMLADVVLMIDGYGQIAEEFEEVEDTLRAVVRRGSGYGVHVVATVSRWNEVRLNQQSMFGNRVELKLGDPGDSGVSRKLSETLSADRPGRVLLQNSLFAQIALPRIDGESSPTSGQDGLRDLVARVSSSTTANAPPIRLLPPVVSPDMVGVSERRGLVPLGQAESDLATVWLDTDGADRNLVVIGDPGTGRTAMLRQLIATLTSQYTPDELVFAVFDPRRTLHGVVPEPYLGGYAASSALAERLVAAVVPQLQQRIPDSVDGAIHSHSGPRIVVLADDYDVLTAGHTAPLAGFLPYVAMGGEIGLSVVLTRRTGGAARGVYEAVFMAAQDASATAILFSGDRSEGQLIGSVRPQRLPIGRAQLVRTGSAPTVVQTVWREYEDEDADDVSFGASDQESSASAARQS